MKVIVACEYSGRVRQAFRNLGHEAYSCDLLPSLDKSPYHYQDNIFNLLDGSNYFDLLIAHPPCTHLAVSGARWFKDKLVEQEQALQFVKDLMNVNIQKICIENPVSIISSKIRKPDQIIQPWMFGDPYTKTTCLWLKNLPKLVPNNIVDKGEIVIHGGKRIQKWYSNRSIPRDMTFFGIANAMAEQWNF